MAHRDYLLPISVLLLAAFVPFAKASTLQLVAAN